MIRKATTVASLVLVTALSLAGTAQARKHKPASDDTSDAADTGAKSKAKGKEGSAKPVQLASFGDWNAYLAAKGRTKTCYTLASPKTRKPDVKRDAAYVFIADRPAEKVHNEVSIIMGFPLKDSGPLEAKVGSTSFDLVAKGSNAWIKNTKDEARFVDALKHSGKLVVKAAAQRGPATIDTYALTGLKQALDRVGKECK